MTWVVFWVVVNTFLVPCPAPVNPIAEYGIQGQALFTTALACYDSVSTRMSKEFDTKEEAEAFVAKGKTLCQGDWDNCQVSGWHITEEPY